MIGVVYFSLIFGENGLDNGVHYTWRGFEMPNLVRGSCFFEVKNSEWVKNLKGKVTPEYKHIVIKTYDDVFEFVCRRYEMSTDGSYETFSNE